MSKFFSNLGMLLVLIALAASVIICVSTFIVPYKSDSVAVAGLAVIDVVNYGVNCKSETTYDLIWNKKNNWEDRRDKFTCDKYGKVTMSRRNHSENVIVPQELNNERVWFISWIRYEALMLTGNTPWVSVPRYLWNEKLIGQEITISTNFFGGVLFYKTPYGGYDSPERGLSVMPTLH